jgi:DnaJ-class molecular chaperone
MAVESTGLQENHIVVGRRCDECGGDRNIPRSGRRRGTRTCPVCRGKGEFVEVLTLTRFRELHGGFG